MSAATNLLLGGAAILLFVSAVIAVGRIAYGPSQLDRSAAADLMVAIVIASIGLWVARTHSSTELNALLLLSMLGFTSAVAIARMVADRRISRRRYADAHDEPEAQK